MAGGTPSITTSMTGAAVIATVTARATPPASATTTATPRRSADKAPSGVMVAMAALRDVQRTGDSTGEPWRSMARAESIARVPERTSDGASTSIEAAAALATMTSIVVLTAPDATVIVAVPGACAVNTPAASTLATVGFEDSQRSRALSTRAPVSERALASRMTQSPTSMPSASGSTRTAATPERSVRGARSPFTTAGGDGGVGGGGAALTG